MSNHNSTQKRILEKWKTIAVLMMLYDYVVVISAYFVALLVRFDFRYSAIPPNYYRVAQGFLPVYGFICIGVFWCFQLYRSIWRYASFSELSRIIYSTFVTLFVQIVGVRIAFLIQHSVSRMPLSYYVAGPMFQFVGVIAIRFGYRLVLLIRGQSPKGEVENVLLYGAGAAGQIILRDANHTNKTNDRVVCIIDDDRNKWHRMIDGVPVVGGRDEILSAVEKYGVTKIYIAIPSAKPEQKRDIINLCNETQCEIKQLPGMYQLFKGDISVSQMKNVPVEDLLGREPIRIDLQEVFNFINGRVVLVTGGGGSIGSELCRQIAGHNPKQLIIFDIYENNAYDIQLELQKKYPYLNLVTLIGSVRDSRKMFEVFERYRPQIVYHAAAHKHVPLMESSPCEAIKNNTLGTYKTAYAAMVHGCERFVLISTDKAVNPTNIMGASKRLCEMIIQAFDRKIKDGRAKDIPQLFTHEGVENADKDGTGGVFKSVKTEFVAVRFGNVLGSNGSVIPLFKKQIENGGPVTVTHPEIIRYFMTIPEAVSLVMQAGTYAHGGEIYVLDMGSPVKIVDLARNLIRLSGYKPDVDIRIEYTGLRPGEKLYEEKLMAEEGLKKTDNELIHIGCPIPFDEGVFLKQLDQLMNLAYANKEEAIIEMVAAMVCTYHPEGIVRENDKGAA